MSPRHAFASSPAAALLLTLLLGVALGDDQVPTGGFDDWVTATLKDFEEGAEAVDGGGTAAAAALDARLQFAEGRRRIVTVRQDGTGDFWTVTEAVASIPDGNDQRTVIKIGPGVYREKVVVGSAKPYVTFYGDPVSNPTVTFNGTAAQFGTWDSATVAVDSHYFMAINIIFENSAPIPRIGVVGAQAVAMRISGDKAAFYNCRFYGYQDTLCDDKGKHFFKNCIIRGTEDFIFGNGRSIYVDCEIVSVAEPGGVTAIVAQGRDKTASKGGFSFIRCRIVGTGSAYLCRAWRESARVVFSFTYMDTIVNPKGWDDFGNPQRDGTVYYGEYKCMGPGSATSNRVSYSRVLTDQQVRPFLSKTFIKATTWLLPPPLM